MVIAKKLETVDLNGVADFMKVVKNYLKLKRLENGNIPARAKVINGDFRRQRNSR